jgi:MraZ protein
MAKKKKNTVVKNDVVFAAVDGEVLFVGMIDRFAIWSKSRYEQSKLSAADFAALLKDRMMKKETNG